MDTQNNQDNQDNSTKKLENDEIAMYIVLNNDLGMGKGKMVSQGAHAACRAVVKLEQLCYKQRKISDACVRYKKWSNEGCAKIVIKATQKELEDLCKLPESYCIYDAGRTQISPNSLTAVAFGPNYKSVMAPIVGKFKLM